MQPLPDAPEACMPAHETLSEVEIAAAREGRIARFGTVLWPSFLVAAALDGVVFSLVDPASLHGFAQQPLGWSDSSVYTLAFFVFWTATAAACAASQWLMRGSAP